MKILTRAFTLKEKILIGILILIILGLGYYKFVDMNVRDGLAAAKDSIETNQAELEISTAMLQKLQSMDKELTSYEAGGITYLASYNNIKEEIAFLDSILKDTVSYRLNLSDPVLNGDLIRRNISIQFVATGYEQARSIVNQFSTSQLRNIIQDISYSGGGSYNGVTTASVTMTVTFYETIVDGTPDAGLVIPVDTSAGTTE